MDDKFVSGPNQNSGYNFKLKLKGDKDDIDAFVEKAAEFSNSRGGVARPHKYYFIVDISYASIVHRDMLANLAYSMKLEILDIEVNKG